jgi:hypothetical protein
MPRLKRERVPEGEHIVLEFLTEFASPMSAIEDDLDRGNAFHNEQQQSERVRSGRRIAMIAYIN